MGMSHDLRQLWPSDPQKLIGLVREAAQLAEESACEAAAYEGAVERILEKLSSGADLAEDEAALLRAADESLPRVFEATAALKQWDPAQPGGEAARAAAHETLLELAPAIGEAELEARQQAEEQAEALADGAPPSFADGLQKFTAWLAGAERERRGRDEAMARGALWQAFCDYLAHAEAIHLDFKLEIERLQQWFSAREALWQSCSEYLAETEAIYQDFKLQVDS
ncbi:hypothetical protein DIPPA_23172 [Diplonema papillatum]|nr:hypothetical protein DIPPA_23172 [Diplonema papillatum]